MPQAKRRVLLVLELIVALTVAALLGWSEYGGFAAANGAGVKTGVSGAAAKLGGRTGPA